MAKDCFANSQRVMLLGDMKGRLTYAEGRAGDVHHGWLMIGGKVVDLTLGAARVGLNVSTRKADGARFRALGIDLNDRMAAEYVGALYTHEEVDACVAQWDWGATILDEIDALTRKVES
jgi:hypothetical protein